MTKAGFPQPDSLLLVTQSYQVRSSGSEMPLPRVPGGTRSRLRQGQVWDEANPEAQNTKVKEEPTLGLVTVQGLPLQEPVNESFFKS